MGTRGAGPGDPLCPTEGSGGGVGCVVHQSPEPWWAAKGCPHPEGCCHCSTARWVSMGPAGQLVSPPPNQQPPEHPVPSSNAPPQQRAVSINAEKSQVISLNNGTPHFLTRRGGNGAQLGTDRHGCFLGTPGIAEPPAAGGQSSDFFLGGPLGAQELDSMAPWVHWGHVGLG